MHTNHAPAAHGVLKSAFKGVGHVKIEANENSTVLRHYDTAIVEIRSNGDAILANGGHKTATTKKFINKALAALGIKAGIYQKAGTWYVQTASSTDAFHDLYTIKA